MTADIVIAIVGGATAVTGGFFATIKHFSTKQRQSQHDFLDHLEKKNGHFERVTKEMAEKHSASNERLAEELGNLRNTLDNNNRVMDKVTDIIVNNQNR